MLERINGNEQISKYWSKMLLGSPQYNYELVHDGEAISGVRRKQSVLKEAREKSDSLIMAYIEWGYGLIKENLMMAF